MHFDGRSEVFMFPPVRGGLVWTFQGRNRFLRADLVPELLTTTDAAFHSSLLILFIALILRFHKLRLLSWSVFHDREHAFSHGFV